MKLSKIYVYELNVLFEDVDWGGVVHHPNYLNYLERARIAAFEVEGIPFQDVIKKGYGIVVAEMRLKFLRPLTMGLKIFVYSQLVACKRSSLKINQIISDVSYDPSCLSSVVEITNPLFQCQGRFVWIKLDSSKAVEPPLEWMSFSKADLKDGVCIHSDTRLDL